jgi:uncharacterized membrane protein YgcG
MKAVRLAAIVALAWLFGGSLLWAANTYKAGDAVQVNYLGEWRRGQVVATNARGEVLADIEFAGSSTRRTVPGASVRYEYEADAMAPSRMWSDPSGTFKTKAALLRIDGEAIVIRKPDMKELTIQVASLSPGDQAFIRSLQKKMSDAVGSGQAWVAPPPIEVFSGSGESGDGGRGSGGKFGGGAFSGGGNAFGGGAAAFNGEAGGFGNEKPVAITPDPAPGYLRMKQGGFAFPLDDFHDRISGVIPIGGTENWVLACVGNVFAKDKMGTRLLWISLNKQKVDQRHMMPPGEHVLDYHPPSRRMLTLTPGGFDKPTLFTLWHASPVEKELKPIVRWRADSARIAESVWARIVDGKIVVQRGDKQQYVAWDTEKKSVAYRVNQESFFAPYAVLSGGRKYLLMPEDERVRVIDAVTGTTLAAYPAAQSVSGLSMSEDGTKLAVLERYSLRIWNVTNPDEPETRIAAEAIGTPFKTKFSWVGNERLMTEDGHSLVLFSLKRRMALWNYSLDMNAMPEHGATRTHEIVDRHLVYAASVSQGSTRGLAVGAVQLPGPKVDEVDAQTDPDSLLLVKRGTKVRLFVECGPYTDEVKTALAEKMEKNGWVSDDTSTTVLYASMKQGESQEVKYRMGGFGKPESVQSATLTPYISNLELYIGEKVAWSSGTRTGAPGMVSLREGQSLQDEVNRWQNPNPDFYKTVTVPESIMDPAKRNGLGTTSVTNRGLVPK